MSLLRQVGKSMQQTAGALIEEYVGVSEGDLRLGAPSLQKVLCGFVDKINLDALTDAFRADGVRRTMCCAWTTCEIHTRTTHGYGR